MARTRQKRTLQTRARLISAASDLIARQGFEALRVEEVVLRAGVAKGTFFAHFKDKDGLMELVIAERIDAHLDRLEALPPPADVDALADGLMPMMNFMTCERYVFDVILRHSGAAALERIGPIAMTFERRLKVLAPWLAEGPFRKDVSPDMLAEGVDAFAFQAMALNFCALHQSQALGERLLPHLRAWLTPAV